MTPEVSVVMAVHNGEGELSSTIASVLSQRDVDFEFIVVDDGSTDMTPIIIERFAIQDRRVRTLHLTKVGVTRALMAGCSIARGALIARQDCGDRSLPERLFRQTRSFQTQSNLVLSAVGSRFIGPKGEWLYDVSQTTDQMRAGLFAEGENIHGPSHHGATMFRRCAYEAVGGYRAAFEVAQDIDLWLRLAEIGECVSMQDILYEATLSIGAISHVRRPVQIDSRIAISACAAARRSGKSDAPIIDSWRAAQRRRPPKRSSAQEAAAFNYFLGSALRARGNDGAGAYFRAAFCCAPWLPKIWLRLVEVEIERVINALRSTQQSKAPD